MCDKPLGHRALPIVLTALWSTSTSAQTPPSLSDEERTSLQPLLELMNTAVISASKSTEMLSEAPATMIVVSRKDIELRGYTQFREILDDLPGFDTMLAHGDTFVKPYLRGFRNNIGDSFLIMVDGQVFNHLWFNTADSATVPMPLSNIKQVEVVYGPASAMYGANAFMGVINVITDKGYAESKSMNATLMGGTFSQRGVDLNWRQNLGQWGYSLTVRRHEGDVDRDAMDRYEYTSTKFSRSFEGHSIFGRLVSQYGGQEWAPWRSTALDVRVWVGELEFGVQHLSAPSKYGTHYASDKYYPASSKWDRPEWSFFAKYDHAFNRAFSTSATARYRLSGASSDNLDWWTAWDSSAKAFITYPEFWASISSSLEFNQDFQWHAAQQLTFNFGYVLSQEIQQKDYMHGVEDGVGIGTAIVTPSDAGPRPSLNLSDPQHFAILRRGGYLQAKYRIDEHQSLRAGIRNDWQSTFKEAVTVRGGYVSNWGGFNLKALYGQAYQEPTPRQLYVRWTGAMGSEALRPQRSWTTELGVGYTAARWGVNANLYKIRNSNLILTTTGGSAQNAGTMDITGLDLHGQLKFVGVLGKQLSVWAYLTNTLNATGDPYNAHLNALNSRDIGDIAKTKAQIGATALFTDSMSLTLKGRHIGARNVVATNPARQVSAFNTFEMHFQLSHLMTRNLSLGLKITNLTDAKYFHPGLADADAGVTPATFDANGDYVGSQGYHSSLLPQAGRGYEAMIRYRF